MADDTFKKTDTDEFKSTTADEWLVDVNIIADAVSLTWEQQAPAPTVVHLAEKQDLSWQQPAPLGYMVQAESEAVELTWAIQQDTHEIKIDVAKQDLTWTIKSEVTPTAIATPEKLEITQTLQTASPVVKVLPDAAQELTWTLNSPSISTAIGKTVFPSTITLTWLLGTISIGTDHFTDTDADKWTDAEDVWQFKTGGATAKILTVDKQILTWSAPAPTVTYDKVVYPYDYLRDEQGFPIRDEPGNPIAIGKPVLEGTWSIQQPTIVKNPECLIEPNGLTLSWTLESPTIVKLNTVSPEAQTLTWALNAPSVILYASATVTPAALTAEWNVNRPRIIGTARRSRSKGMLLGVYRR